MINWAVSARADLREILAYFDSINEEDTGRAIVSKLIKSVSRLEEFPLSGKVGKKAGTRELIPNKLPYLLIYHLIDPKAVEIVAVHHTSKPQDEE